ncbi:hypothetical protein RHGRI_024313 [Rhododendron griersonianum]|uniref:Uncharacterized protein n=1 Tax=Rhododendron griersonianum TaxID=479676 RepID=A0AAV6JC99_9ERIC|nr:hypothetical protein RHGRI_024313 [Rhododendron griersonianum]
MDTSKKSLSEQIEEQFRERAEARRCVEAGIRAQNNYLAMMKDSTPTTGKSAEVAQASKNLKLQIDAQNDFINNYLNK